ELRDQAVDRLAVDMVAVEVGERSHEHPRFRRHGRATLGHVTDARALVSERASVLGPDELLPATVLACRLAGVLGNGHARHRRECHGQAEHQHELAQPAPPRKAKPPAGRVWVSTLEPWGAGAGVCHVLRHGVWFGVVPWRVTVRDGNRSPTRSGMAVT